MSRKHFSWLLAATVLVGVVVFLLPGRTSRDAGFEVEHLLPGLAAKVNELDQVRVIRTGNKTVATLTRNEGQWVVEEFSSYRADWEQLRGILAALAQARMIEAKTSNPAYFPRLGVESPDSDDSQSTLLQLGAEDSGMSVIIGKAAEGRDGQYVRLAGSDQSWLVDQEIELPREAKDFLQREIVNLADTEVVEVNIVHPDGETIRTTKVSADDDDFVLQGIPEGREIQSAWSVNNLASALNNLQLDDVARTDAVDFSAASQFRLMTADGLEISADVADFEDQRWIRLSAAAYETAAMALAREQAEAVEEGIESLVESQADAENLTGESEDGLDSEVAEDVAEAVEAEAEMPESTAPDRAREINQRVEGWAYAIPAYKAEVMTRRLEDLLKPPASEGTGE